jgi:hypothetical protein
MLAKALHMTLGLFSHIKALLNYRHNTQIDDIFKAYWTKHLSIVSLPELNFGKHNLLKQANFA